MEKIKPIHPFPARMAPEIVSQICSELNNESLILDPMSGSGTVLRIASEYGHKVSGFDLDPLSILISKVWTTPIDVQSFKEFADNLIEKAIELKKEEVKLHWIDSDQETREFVDFWFDQPQVADLRKLSYLIFNESGPISDAIRVAISRMIITKKKGASLAGDVSHSRPHRIREKNDYDVIKNFRKSIKWIYKRLKEQPPKGKVSINIGDARNLKNVKKSSFDAVVTSPPYLNALDYLRGHKLALIWFGYTIKEIRNIRSETIGIQRVIQPDNNDEFIKTLVESAGDLDKLSSSKRRMIKRYANDIYKMLKEVSNVLKPQGQVVLVIGNSSHKGVFVKNTSIVKKAAEILNFSLLDETVRKIPPNKRYLPPPSKLSESDLKKRMRTESILTFQNA